MREHDGGVDGLTSDVARVRTARRLVAGNAGSVALDRLTALAARLVGASSAQVSLIGDEQTVVGGSGLPPGAVGGVSPASDSLCLVTVLSGRPLVVDDAPVDDRVAHLPPVATGQVGAYLGVPLVGASGGPLGTLCVFDPAPRAWSHEDEVLLTELAGAVSAELELAALSSDYDTVRLRLGLAMEAAGIGAFDLELATGRLTWDDRLMEIFGYAPGEFDGTMTAFFDRVHPDDVAHVTSEVELSLADRRDMDVQYRVVRPDGAVRWLVARGRLVLDSEGVALRLVGTADDRTEERDGATRLARLLESMPNAFCSFDTNWAFSYVNARAEALLGRTRDELVGGSVWDLFPAAVGREFETQYRAAVSTGEPVEFEAYYPHPLDRWYVVRAWPGPEGLSVHFHDATDRRQLLQQAELLGQVSEQLAAEREPHLALVRLARLVAPTLADWCGAELLDEWGRVVDGAVWTVGYTVGDAPPDDAHVVVLPLTARGRTLGRLTLTNLFERGPLSAEDRATAADVALRAALSLDNVRLYREQRNLAETLQHSMLTAPPEPDHLQIVVRYVPAALGAEVGGDWYDAFLQRDGATVLVIGDVTGHDVESAAEMGQVRGLLRGIAYTTGASPSEVLTRLDQAIAGLQVDTSATALVLRLEQTPDERDDGETTLCWSSAGHPPPLVMAPDGVVTALSTDRHDMLLGIAPDSLRSEWHAQVVRGSTVLLYTDGLVERRREPLAEGMERLVDTLASLGTAPTLDELCDGLVAKMLCSAPEDDVALVAVRLHRQDGPRPPEAGPANVPPGVPDD